ncbi:hypothetical protein N7462_000805 [Penicillium macrosclerotiorum]|uniref:uncharacterized protein n=1 Tax=Penicillium macrosclerotiorum TaxID=303699 RepID=UPI002546B536|nr:uncharacterized protein N7462_000805 [Penicillium macrosclerotiorum]KAJ5698800.1 hypothetical protein N7462_000805 [Penicillium macrosclerotiorum]
MDLSTNTLMASVDMMIDQEDWSHISEPALRKRIQNRNSQRKLRKSHRRLGPRPLVDVVSGAKRKLQNQSIPFEIMASTPVVEEGSDVSTPLSESFMDSVDTFYASLDLDLSSIDPEVLGDTTNRTIETASLPTPTWTTDADVGYFDPDFSPWDAQQALETLPLDPALADAVSGKKIIASAPQHLPQRQPNSGDVHIYIHNPNSMTVQPGLAAVSGPKGTSSNESAPNQSRRSKFSAHIFPRGFETGCSSRNSPGTWKQSFRQWNRCGTKSSSLPAREVATCINCGHHVAVREPAEPSHERVVEMLSECSPELAELAKQPNVRISYGLPPLSSEQRSRDMTSTEEEMEGAKGDENGNAKPSYILIYTGHDRP